METSSRFRNKPKEEKEKQTHVHQYGLTEQIFVCCGVVIRLFVSSVAPSYTLSLYHFEIILSCWYLGFAQNVMWNIQTVLPYVSSKIG